MPTLWQNDQYKLLIMKLNLTADKQDKNIAIKDDLPLSLRGSK